LPVTKGNTEYLSNTSERKEGGLIITGGCCWWDQSVAELDILRKKSFSVNVMKGKFWCMLPLLCLIGGKYLAANVKKGYSQVGNELLHEAGSSWVV